jgi:hypothetical protein
MQALVTGGSRGIGSAIALPGPGRRRRGRQLPLEQRPVFPTMSRRGLRDDIIASCHRIGGALCQGAPTRPV